MTPGVFICFKSIQPLQNIVGPWLASRQNAPPCTCVKNYSQIWTEGNRKGGGAKNHSFLFSTENIAFPQPWRKRRERLERSCPGKKKKFIWTIKKKKKIIWYNGWQKKWVHFPKRTPGCCEEKGKQEMGSDVHSLSAVCEMRPGDCNMSARSVKRCRFLFSLPPFLNGYAACNTSREQIFIWAYYQLHQQYYFAIIHSFVRRKLQKKNEFCIFLFYEKDGKYRKA